MKIYSFPKVVVHSFGLNRGWAPLLTRDGINIPPAKVLRARGMRRMAMHHETLIERISAIVAGVLRHRQSIFEPPGGRTVDDLSLNALDRIFIADALEREWSIELDEDEIDAWQTLGDIATSVHNRMP